MKLCALLHEARTHCLTCGKDAEETQVLRYPPGGALTYGDHEVPEPDLTPEEEELAAELDAPDRGSSRQPPS